MGNIENNDFKSIFLPLSTYFWEETNIMDITYTLHYLFFPSTFKQGELISFLFFPSPLLPSIFHSIKQSLMENDLIVAGV